MYQTIVVGTDCSPTADNAVAKAAELAKAVGATVHVVSAYSEPAGSLVASGVGQATPPSWAASEIEDRQGRLNATAEHLRSMGINALARIERGDASTTLVTVAEEVGADLIVVGDRGLKGLRGLLGSVPSSVTRRAPIDVLVVHTS
jgi:nucleotide-binding universal stress UspA family protein